MFALDAFLDGQGARQQEVFTDGLPGEGAVGHQGVAAEEFICQPGCIVGCHLDELRQGSRNGIGRIGHGTAARSQVAGTAAFIDFVGVSDRLVAVFLVDVVRIRSVGTPLETADFTA